MQVFFVCFFLFFPMKADTEGLIFPMSEGYSYDYAGCRRHAVRSVKGGVKAVLSVIFSLLQLAFAGARGAASQRETCRNVAADKRLSGQ